LGTFLGIDLGGTNIKFTIVEIQGGSFRELQKGQITTEASLGPEHVTKRIANLISSFDDVYSTEGVAVAVPGIFDHDNGNILLFPNLPGNWNQYPLVDYLTELTGKKSL